MNRSITTIIQIYIVQIQQLYSMLFTFNTLDFCSRIIYEFCSGTRLWPHVQYSNFCNIERGKSHLFYFDNLMYHPYHLHYYHGEDYCIYLTMVQIATTGSPHSPYIAYFKQKQARYI
eukprot:253370_1